MISTIKYNVIFIIQLLLVFGVLGGGGYLVYKNVTDKENKEEIKEEEVIVPDIQELDEDIVAIDINENIVYDGYDVSIRIPKVTNEQGTDINNKIKVDLKEYYDNKDTSIEYDYFINNDIVSIENKEKEENFFTYNFDMNDYSLIDNHKLLELKGIKEDSFHGLLVNIYEDYLKNNVEEKEEVKGEIKEDNKQEDKKEEKKQENKIDVTTDDYKKTTDKDNCSINLPMYLDQDNHLNVVFNEYKDNNVIKQIYNLNAKKVVER